MRKGPTRAYIKRGIWHLVERRKEQKGEFFPILGAITKPLLNHGDRWNRIFRKISTRRKTCLKPNSCKN